jgi:hypothetical protein
MVFCRKTARTASPGTGSAPAELILRTAGSPLSLILTVVSAWQTIHALEDQLSDFQIGIEHDVVEAEVHELERDGSIETRMDRGRREMDQETAPRERAAAFYSGGVDGALRSNRKPDNFDRVSEDEGPGLEGVATRFVHLERLVNLVQERRKSRLAEIELEGLRLLADAEKGERRRFTAVVSKGDFG